MEERSERKSSRNSQKVQGRSGARLTSKGVIISGPESGDSATLLAGVLGASLLGRKNWQGRLEGGRPTSLGPHRG